MKRISALLSTGKILVSDGAWGTFLHAKGLKPGECPELWNIDHPDHVFDIAKSYIDAGANMVETNSFGGNRIKLSHYQLENMAFKLNEAAAEISRRAAGPTNFVLGSIGPTGKMLMMGDVTEDELYEAFKEQAMGLESGGADAIVIETMSDIEEARQAIRASKENTSCEIICTMTFSATVDGEYRTMMGNSPSEMMSELVSEGVDIIGTNCGNGIEGMVDIVKEIRSCDKKIPVLVHANAGKPIYSDGKTLFPESPDQTGSFVEAIIHAGANIIGGCCGTTPEHIRAIAKAVSKFQD